MKRLYTILIIILTLLITISIPVKADMGPKPFLDIEIKGLNKSDYIIGLLSKTEKNGPYSIFTEDTKKDDYNEDIYDTLVLINSKLPEDEYYLTELVTSYKEITECHYIINYYPPKYFKLYIYDINSNTINVSNPYETYAFSSYYKCEFQGDLRINNERFTLDRNYNYSKEVLLFIVRLIITLVIELLLALLFKFNKKSMLIILVINFITQLCLNGGLNLFVYQNGKNILGLPLLIFGEIIILIVEITCFRMFCFRKDKDKQKKYIILYAIIANCISFIASIILWFI